jgi:tripeptidyl-peptidase-1
MHVDYIKPAVAMSAPVEKRNIAKRSNAEAFRAHLQILGAFASPKKTTPPTNATGGREFLVDAAVPCSNGVTGDCMSDLYGIPEPTTSDKVNDLGIYESGASYSQADLNTFYEDYATNVPSGTGPSLMSVNGGSAPSSQSNANFEANIDFEMAYTLIYPQQTVIYQDGTPESNSETFLDGFLDYLDGSYCSSADQNDGYQCGAGSATKVISISYTQTELAITQASQQRSCNEIMKLTMQGITFVIASGQLNYSTSP